MFGNVCPNMIILAMKDILNTPLYNELNVHIHIVWKYLCAIYSVDNTQHN